MQRIAHDEASIVRRTAVDIAPANPLDHFIDVSVVDDPAGMPMTVSVSRPLLVVISLSSTPSRSAGHAAAKCLQISIDLAIGGQG